MEATEQSRDIARAVSSGDVAAIEQLYTSLALDLQRLLLSAVLERGEQELQAEHCDQAAEMLQLAIRLAADSHDEQLRACCVAAHRGMAEYYEVEVDDLDAACAELESALRVQPASLELVNQTALACIKASLFDRGLMFLNIWLGMEEDAWQPHMHIAGCRLSLGDPDGALHHFRRYQELAPRCEEREIGWLLPLNYTSSLQRDQVSAAHIEWGARIGAKALGLGLGHPVWNRAMLDPDRIIRVGYLSCDFFDHVVARFLLAPLRHHMRDAVRVTCYSTRNYEDSITEELKGLADAWVNLEQLGAQEVIRF